MSGIEKLQSPRTKRKGSIFSIQSSYITESKQKQKAKSQIQQLIHRFNEANQKVEIDVDQTNFNLTNYERENEKIKYDPQMMVAKLRKLQNRAQIKRAQMEIDNRQKKFFHSYKKKKPSQKQEKYKDIYNKYLKGRKLSDELDDGSDEESNHNETGPQGISFYQDLKKHPKILQYTMCKINDKSREKIEKENRLKEMQDKVKENMDYVSPQYKEIMQDTNKKVALQATQQTNPQTILDGSFSKIFSKKSNQNIKKDIRDNPRCLKIMQKHNEILMQIEDRSLSKDGKKKLKSRLNEIVMEISKSQKAKTVTLPKIFNKKPDLI